MSSTVGFSFDLFSDFHLFPSFHLTRRYRRPLIYFVMRLPASAIFALFVLTSGCASQQQPTDMLEYSDTMTGMEKWIAKSSTFTDFQKEVEMNQQPTYYKNIQFKQFTPTPGANLVSMRSTDRKNSHEVLIHGAALTKTNEGVQYWITIDEAAVSK